MAVEEAIAGDGLILNCGTTTHMFTEKVYFESLKSEKSSHFVTIGVITESL